MPEAQAIWVRDARAWAAAVVALPAPGLLPGRVVLVPNERVAHSLRRELLRLGRADALPGTLFLSAIAAAQAVLRGAGVRFQLGEDRLRPSRVARLFTGARAQLEHFPIGLLRTAQGWDEAFARTIGELERAGLSASDLAGDAHAALRDIGQVWRLLDEEAGEGWTVARTLAEAAMVLSPGTWPFPGATLAAVDGHESVVHARFVRAIPGVVLALHEARPYRAGHLARLRELLAIEIPTPVSRAPTSDGERELLVAYLFEPPESIGSTNRGWSAGPAEPAMVILEEHAGIESELEGAADWVAQRVLAGTPLEDIAVLTPGNSHLAGSVAERLQRLPWQGGSLPVYLPEGRPAASCAAGARIVAILRALRAWLPADSLASVLPFLSARLGDAMHLSREEAIELVYSLGTLGGSPASPDGALSWKGRLLAAEQRILAELANTGAIDTREDTSRATRNLARLQSHLARLRAVRPAVDALCEVARLVVQRAPLTAIWPALRAFLDAHARLPESGAPMPALLASALGPLLDDPMSAAISGDDAMRAIEEVLGRLSLPDGRFGEPAVYVGSLSGAAGVPFRAVRVVGLCEGAFPSVPREDPVLPQELLARLVARVPAAAMIRTPTERSLAQLHGLDRIVRDTSDAIALSAPSLDANRTQREPSAVFIEVAAAVGRPDVATGKQRRGVSNLGSLQRDWFQPARRAAATFRTETPLTEAAWEDRVAGAAPNSRSVAVPAAWSDRTEIDLVRIRALAAEDASPGACDGLLVSRALLPRLPGLGPELAISASSLGTLLSCPHRFLLQKVLGWDEPAAAPSPAAIDPRQYGSLFHRVAEEFFREHGEAFLNSGSTLSRWDARAAAIADRAFDELVESYPIAGDSARQAQRDGLRREFREFLRREIESAGKVRFADVERSFGYPTPLRIPVGRQALHVHGYIDRIDRRGRTTVVRDLKTGRSKPRRDAQQGPTHTIDVQIGLYGIVTRLLASAWGLTDRIEVAYTFVSGRGESERAFREDFEVLEEAATGWLRLAARLLSEASFPRTTDPEDCRFCPFEPVCGPKKHGRAVGVLDGATGALGDFRSLKRGENGE